MINKTAKAILASLILALPLASCASADEILDSLISRAEAQNPMISAYHEKTVRAEEAVKEASAKMGPKAVMAAASAKPDALKPSSLGANKVSELVLNAS